MKKILFITTLLCLAGCNKNLKNTLGLTTTAPDEYKSQRTKSLEVPPHYQLVAPTPALVDTKSSDLDYKNKKNLTHSEKALLQEVK